MRVVVISGSMFGTTDLVADRAVTVLQGAGLQVERLGEMSLDLLLEQQADAWLVCTSTTGMGELPDNLLPLHLQLQERFPLLDGKPFGVIALGDSAYPDTFCAGGLLMREQLLELQGRELLPMLQLDASETVTQEDDAEPWLGEFVEALAARQL
ncbi:MAG: flavodoxin domain-containing protein [Halopseudomonas yangmingensis]|uniref:MioC protein n=1 Tax=Halopseudomonas yangmingensis TaxID=1720063 RepID=A0A1I4N9J0_9GAMM|nr:flavodoxin domain-containing protein [Halopseudomonas yangmingensis]SFM12214.1 MioC protein [Halopseudomonas yangmingensis]